MLSCRCDWEYSGPDCSNRAVQYVSEVNLFLVILVIVFVVLLILLAFTIYCLYLNMKKHDVKKDGDIKDENKKTRKESVAEKKERAVKRKYSAVTMEDDLAAITSGALEDDDSADMISIADGVLATDN